MVVLALPLSQSAARIGLIPKPQTPPFAGGRKGILQYPPTRHNKYFVHDLLKCELTKLFILRSYFPQSVREEIRVSSCTRFAIGLFWRSWTIFTINHIWWLELNSLNGHRKNS